MPNHFLSIWHNRKRTVMVDNWIKNNHTKHSFSTHESVMTIVSYKTNHNNTPLFCQTLNSNGQQYNQSQHKPLCCQASNNKGNAKRGVSPRLKIKPCDLDLWPWKSIGFQTLLRTMYVPSLVKIHWRMLILECSQGCYAVKIWPWHWPLIYDLENQ